MNALTKAAKERLTNDNLSNYVIAIVCGVILGVMLGVAV